MARGRKKRPEGLGDTIENVLEVTGIAKVAKWILGEDCGCEERKQKLNEIFRYKKPLCLQEDEYQWLDSWFKLNKNYVLPSEQGMILKIHSRIFQVRNEPTNCGPCLMERVKELKEVYNVYKEKDDANSEA